MSCFETQMVIFIAHQLKVLLKRLLSGLQNKLYLLSCDTFKLSRRV